MSISAVQVATIGVRHLGASTRFYRDVFGYVEQSTGSASGAAFEALWQMPQGMDAEIVVMGPDGAGSGLIRLVQFDRPGELYWGDYSGMNDYGHYALNLRVPEIRAAIAAITTSGGRARSEPTHWIVTPELSAWDSLSYDPDGVVLDVFQLEPAPGSILSDYDGRPSSLQTVAIHCSDARRSARFYAALGFRPLYDKLLENMESFFDLPNGTKLHNINMMQPDAPDIGRIEIAQYVGWPGTSQRTTAVPPALGILSASLQTGDLSATEALLHSIGAEPATKRVEIDMPGLGHIAARCYYGPDDEVLEIFERL